MISIIPGLTRLAVSSIRTGAEGVTEALISYCEVVVRAAVRATIAVLIAIGLIQASNRWDINPLLLLGVVIGGGGLFYFALASSLGRMAIIWLSQMSDIVKEEVERLSNIFFLFIVTLFYLGIDQGQRHPTLLKVFLGMMVALFVIAILPGKSKTMVRAHERFRVLVLVPVFLMTILAAVPEAITKRVINSHGLERVTGTVAGEIRFHLDDQDQIVNNLSNQPLVFFDQIGSKDSDQPRPLIGWVQDKKDQYRLYYWFEGQKNYTATGQEIKPVTSDRLDDIIVQAKRMLEQKLVDEKKIADEQKVVVDAEASRLQAEGDRKLKAQQEADELARKQQQEQDDQARQQAEAERVVQETAQEEQRQLALQPVPVASTILESADESQDIVMVRPSEQFVYQGRVIQPDQTVMVLDITDVKPAPDKNKYLLTLQPSQLVSGGQRYDISHRTELVQLIVKKDSLWKSLKSTGLGAGAGAILGGITGGKKGAVAGAVVGGVAGHIFSRISHGKKFQLTTGDPVPTIRINPVP